MHVYSMSVYDVVELSIPQFRMALSFSQKLMVAQLGEEAKRVLWRNADPAAAHSKETTRRQRAEMKGQEHNPVNRKGLNDRLKKLNS